jgi:hypothetical protein
VNNGNSKIFYIAENTLLDMLTQQQSGKRIMPIIKGIPEDAVLSRASYDHSRGCFVFRVDHPSFKKAKTGEMFPVLDVEFEMVEVG